ncbi:MAG: glycine cleavage system aminomethyltransferase GcvT [Pirellulaceae bacterium]
MSSTTELLKTPLHDWHASHGGRMVDFAGWSMPVQYTSIIDEHNATRNAVGLFDVSHMGRFYFADPAACEFLNGLTTRRVWPMEAGKIRYSLMTRDDGGVLDDVLVYHLADPSGKAFCFMVVNASNREKILGWLQQHGDLDKLGFEDRTTATAMIAVQGPRALATVDPLCGTAPSSLKYYHGMMTDVCGTTAIVSRTGYTGEDGCELTVPGDKAVEIWQTIIDRSAGDGGSAVGLAARDTLRLEAAMPLYGHELSEDINPAQADVKFAINVKDREFPGRGAIVAARKDESLLRRIGLEMEGKRPAREHSLIYIGNQQVGEVTSGTFSPTLQKPIAMGYLKPEHTEVGTELEIDVRGKRLAAKVCQLPFYSRD